MSVRKLFHNARIVSGDGIIDGCVLVEGEYISDVISSQHSADIETLKASVDDAIDCGGGLLMPGVIDTHVHFRDPGLTEKADMQTESRAALAGGVTSIIDMPNTRPATVTRDALEAKLRRAAEVSAVNYGFFIGATNDNLPELLAADFSQIAGVKLFLGSSTGNMLVDNAETVEMIFREIKVPVAVHAEDEAIIAAARERLLRECGTSVPVERHPDLRPREACIEATRRALDIAARTGAHLHVCHVSTADEIEMIKSARLNGVNVTAETCPQYLLFDRNDFYRLGARIKCNPSVKEPSDRIALLRELLPGGAIDTIATDHAPHLLKDKEGDALTAASGMPMVQFSLPLMLELAETEPELEGLTLPRISLLMSGNPTRVFGIEKRGVIAKGSYADLTLVRKCDTPHRVSDSDVLSRCAWTPLEGLTLSHEVALTVVNGEIAYCNATFSPSRPQALRFIH